MGTPRQRQRIFSNVFSYEKARMPPEDRFAAELGRFGPLGILVILVALLGDSVFVPLSPLVVLAWAWRSRTPWSEIGFARQSGRSWSVTIAAGVVFGALFKLLMKAIVMPLLGADPINRTYHYLVGNRFAIPLTLFLLIVRAGFGEETVFRGFLFERLGRLLGTGARSRAAIVLLTPLLFALAHLHDQGLAGAEQALFTGLVFGTVFAVTRRIWLPMVLHAAFDLTAYMIIYWDLETRVAHLVFK
jgi:membrane protease YdiL (CAAX protease family)